MPEADFFRDALPSSVKREYRFIAAHPDTPPTQLTQDAPAFQDIALEFSAPTTPVQTTLSMAPYRRGPADMDATLSVISMLLALGMAISLFMTNRAKRRAQDSLTANQHAQAAQALLLRDAVEAILTVDSSGTIHTVNPAFATLVGDPRAGQAGANLLDFVSPNTRAQLRDQLAHPNPTAVIQTRLRHPAGHGAATELTVSRLTHATEPSLLLVVIRGTSEHRRAEHLAAALSRSLTSATGEAFFDASTAFLLKHIEGAELAFCGHIDPANPGYVVVDRVRTPDGLQPGFRYGLAGTPCADVLSRGACLYQDRLQSRYPDDLMLVEQGIHAYLGAPMRANEDQAQGIIVVLSSGHFPEGDLARSLLEILAARAAGEHQRMQQHAALNSEKIFLQQVVDSVPEPVVVLSVDRTVRLANQAAQDQRSIQTGDLDAHCSALSPHAPGACSRGPDACLQSIVRRAHTEIVQHHEVRAADGSTRHLEISAAPLFDPDGSYSGMIETTRDITDRRQRETELRDQSDRYAAMALQDTLTELPNRAAFHAELVERLTATTPARDVALLFIDLDRFKQVNDAHGHDAGDQLLRQVADRISERVRGTDLVARLGRDEFTVILDPLSAPDVAESVARKIIASLCEPFKLSTAEVSIGASIGVAMTKTDGRRPQQLLARADAAMYAAKEAGRGTCRFFTEELDSHAQDTRLLEEGLRTALSEGQLHLAYQPIYAVDTSTLVGVEGFARWQHPDRGVVAPARFLAVAIETGLIRPLGTHLIRLALADHAAWRAQGLAPGQLTLNLSGTQLRDPRLIDTLISVAAETAFDLSQLDLDLNEQDLTSAGADLQPIFDRLHALGVGLNLDDFGATEGNVRLLNSLPLRSVKLDASITADTTTTAAAAGLTRALLTIANANNIDLIVEGVETEQQHRFIASSGVRLAQGHYYSKPKRASDIAEMLPPAT